MLSGEGNLSKIAEILSPLCTWQLGNSPDCSDRAPLLTLGCKSGAEHFLEAGDDKNGLKELYIGAGFERLEASLEIN
jgi:hypothetical protein